MKQVRNKATYTYRPVMLDRADPPYGADAGLLQPGDLVRVTNLPGCPAANTMGMCHISDPGNGQFLGLVCVGSLVRE